MTDDERFEAAIRHHSLSEWSESQTVDLVRYALDLDEEQREDAENVMHVLWQMGAAGPKHRGCRIDDDSNYEIACGPCKKFLLELAAKIIATAEQAPQDAGT